jgi:hypothetical protein
MPGYSWLTCFFVIAFGFGGGFLNSFGKNPFLIHVVTLPSVLKKHFF